MTAYTYEGYNRKTEHLTENGTLLKSQTYTYDETDWLTRIDGQGKVITYHFDANGNTLKKSDNTLPNQDTVFTYDSRNQLVESKCGPPASETILGLYDYNAQGLRTRHRLSDRGDIDYYYDGRSVIEEHNTSDSTLVAHYRYADRLISLQTASTTQYYHYDALGSTVNLTNGSGSTPVSYQLDPWGHIRSQSGSTTNRHIFTGKEHDPNTNLIYFGARYYDPDTARFITQDPYLGEQTTPPSLHRFLYAYSNPTVYVDLIGYAASPVWNASHYAETDLLPSFNPTFDTGYGVADSALSATVDLYNIAARFINMGSLALNAPFVAAGALLDKSLNEIYTDLMSLQVSAGPQLGTIVALGRAPLALRLASSTLQESKTASVAKAGLRAIVKSEPLVTGEAASRAAPANTVVEEATSALQNTLEGGKTVYGESSLGNEIGAIGDIGSASARSTGTATAVNAESAGGEIALNRGVIPKVPSNDILGIPNRLQNKLEAWRRYPGEMELPEWSRRYDQLQINRARGTWAESFGSEGANYPTPYGRRLVDNAPATEIKSGYQSATRFIRRQIIKDSFLERSVPGYEPLWRFTDTNPSKRLLEKLETFGIPYELPMR